MTTIKIVEVETLGEMVDEAIQLSTKRGDKGFVVADLRFADITLTVVFAINDGVVLCGPMVFPAEALDSLRQQIEHSLKGRAQAATQFVASPLGNTKH